MNKYVLVCVLSFFLKGCTSDHIVDLGSGYFFRNEGGAIKDILCENAQGGFIPSTVIEYAYDDDFILARQHPKLPPDPLYDVTYQYPENISDFYWIIVKSKNVVIGPLLFYDYLKQKQELQINLELNK